jgi:threonine synthase
MDISMASNFERYVFDLVGRDPRAVRDLWQGTAREGGFDIAGTPYASRVAATGFVSGMSTHADRLATIRDVAARYGVVVDPHTADGIKVGREYRAKDVPLICIETALPAKFGATIREALGRDPARPAAYADLEARPQRCTRLPADAERVKAYIAANATPAS